MDRRWKLVIAFIAGTIFAEVAADPTDYIFFQLRQQMTLEQTVLAWYFLAAAFYIALLIAAYIIASTRLITPETFIYVIMAMVVFGAWMSYRVIAQQSGDTQTAAMLLAIPLTVALGILWRLRKTVE